MGSSFDRSNCAGEREAALAPSPASFGDAPVPDFRGLLRRAANDLRTEAVGKARPEQRDRLLRLAAMLDRYAEDTA